MCCMYVSKSAVYENNNRRMDMYLVSVDATRWNKGARLDDLPAQGGSMSQEGHCQIVSGEVGGFVPLLRSAFG